MKVYCNISIIAFSKTIHLFTSIFLITLLTSSFNPTFAYNQYFDSTLVQTHTLRANNPDSALKLIKTEFNLSKEKKDTSLIIKTGSLFALVQNENGLSNKALGTLLELKTYLNPNSSDSSTARINLISGHVYSDLNRFPVALNNYNNSLSQYLEFNDTLNIVSSYIGIGRVFSNIPILKQAIKYYNLAHQYTSAKDISLRKQIYGNLGTAYGRIKDFKNAEIYFRKALKLGKEENAKRDIALMHYNLGKLLMDKGELDASVKEQTWGLKISQEINSAIDIAWAHEGLYAVYSKRGNDKKALYHFEIHSTLKDSLDQLQNKKEILKLEALYEKKKQDLIIEEQQHKIEDASYKEVLYEERIANSKLEKRVLWLGITLLLSLVLSSIFYFNKMKEKNKLLLKQQEIVHASLSQKEILLKEIHHRVKNNLQIITSLISLQSHNINDEVALEILAESKNKIQAIAMMHENLYQSKNLGAANIKNYLKDLLDYLQHIFQNSLNPVSCHLKSEDLDLNLDTAIPLGLITAELITNCFKHAYQNISNPELELTLLKNKNDKFELSVQDNGIGLPKNFDIKKSKSLGLDIVIGLTAQINAKVEYQSVNGTTFTIIF